MRPIQRNSMIKCVWKYFLGITSIGTAFFCCCDNGTGPNDNSPALSNVSALDSIYAGYLLLSGDPPDTLRISFDYNPSKVTSIDVSATLDSGKSWIPVATVTPDGSTTAKVVWPLNTDADAGHFNFFGIKEGYLNISDKASGASIDSKTFDIIGNTPFILTSPLGGETFSVSDSISVLYGYNTNLSNAIPCVRPNDPDSANFPWVALGNANSVKTISYQRGPIRSYVQKFTLTSDFFKGITSTYNFWNEWEKYPLRIKVRDYGSSGTSVSSGLITITTHSP